jgi:hypothetical protein
MLLADEDPSRINDFFLSFFLSFFHFLCNVFVPCSHPIHTPVSTPNAPFSLLQNTYVIDRHPRGMVGVGGRQYVEVRAAKAGRYVLVMEYRRPWEKTAAQKREFEVQVAAEPSR